MKIHLDDITGLEAVEKWVIANIENLIRVIVSIVFSAFSRSENMKPYVRPKYGLVRLGTTMYLNELLRTAPYDYVRSMYVNAHLCTGTYKRIQFCMYNNVRSCTVMYDHVFQTSNEK